LYYDGGDPVPPPGPPDPGPRTAIVRLACGGADFANPQFIDGNANHKPGDPYLYEIDANTKYACGVGLGGGAIFLIILLVLGVVYVAGGFIYNKAIKKEPGLGFPNEEFWKDSPGMAKDGVMFLLSKITGGKVGYTAVS